MHALAFDLSACVVCRTLTIIYGVIKNCPSCGIHLRFLSCPCSIAIAVLIATPLLSPTPTDSFRLDDFPPVHVSLCFYGNRLDLRRGDHCLDLPGGGTLGMGRQRVGERLKGRRRSVGGLRRRRFLWIWCCSLDGSVAVAVAVAAGHSLIGSHHPHL